MSTPFYDLASVVVLPSGYKSGKIYAQKPLTTDGQLTFTRASTATRVNASGLIETVSSGVPRLDYLGSSCPKILLEPQRSNIALYSEQFDNAYWGKARCTVSANVLASPDGTTDADALVEDTTNNSHPIYRGFTFTNSTAYTFSIFAKKGSRRYLRINMTNGGSPIYYDFDTKTAGSGGSVVDYGNGWLRLIYTYTTNNTSGEVYVEPSINGTSASYLGNGSTAAYLYGAQLEAGAYATSYIPTLGTSVTRVADAASKTGISSLIGQTEGTMFVEFNVGGQDGRVISTLGGSNRFGITASPTTVGAFIVTAAGGVVYSNATAFTHGATTKMAFGYKSGQSVLYVNGSAVLTITASFAFNAAITDLFLSQQEFAPGAGQSGQRQAQALVFKTRLTNAQLAELTTL